MQTEFAGEREGLASEAGAKEKGLVEKKFKAGLRQLTTQVRVFRSAMGFIGDHMARQKTSCQCGYGNPQELL